MFPDFHADLCWSEVHENHKTRRNAEVFCNEMGGRLPTIDELRMVIINCPATGIGGQSNNSEDDCLSRDCRDRVCGEGCQMDFEDRGYYSAFGDETPLQSGSNNIKGSNYYGRYS